MGDMMSSFSSKKSWTGCKIRVFPRENGIISRFYARTCVNYTCCCVFCQIFFEEMFVWWRLASSELRRFGIGTSVVQPLVLHLINTVSIQKVTKNVNLFLLISTQSSVSGFYSRSPDLF